MGWYREALVVVVVGLVVGLSLVAIAYETSVAVNKFSFPYGPSYIVAKQNATWASGIGRVWVNFSLPSTFSYMTVRWGSSGNIRYHILVGTFYYEEIILGSDYCASCSEPYTGRGSTPPGPTPSTSWFQLENCPPSGCPGGWVNYTVTENSVQ